MSSSSFSSFAVPLVNLDDFSNPDTRDEFVRTLGLAFSSSGYLRLSHHGVDLEAMRAYQDEARTVLREPLEKKLCFHDASSGGLTGYFHAPRSVNEKLSEDVEMWHVMQDPNVLVSPHDFPFSNVWPDDNDAFRRLGEQLFRELYRVAETVLAASAICLNRHEDDLKNLVNGGLTILRVIRYAAPETAATLTRKVRFDAHKDVNLLTILSGGSAAGLELFRGDTGEWIEVSALANEIVIGVGDLFEAMTQGRFKSALHRVVASDPISGQVSENHLSGERYSCPFFITPRAEVSLAALGAESRADESVYQFLKARLGLHIPRYEDSPLKTLKNCP